MLQIAYNDGFVTVSNSQGIIDIPLKNLTMDSRKALVEAVKYLNVE